MGDALDEETFQKYLLALRDLYVIEELEAWNPYLRSRVAISSKPARHFVDPSIAAASLGIGPDGLFSDMTTFGLLFESLAIRDLRIYAENSGAKVYKYRDAKNREADAAIQWGDGSFALIEVKLGGKDDVEEAARKLLLLSSDIDQRKTGRLSFLLVITKGPAAYRREDGVYVAPLGSLCA